MVDWWIMALASEIENIVKREDLYPDVSAKFLDRLSEGQLTRDENPTSHFCVYFAPYNPRTKKVFLGHHKKSGLWLFNGGHIDANENILHALTREMDEEWGMRFAPENFPFLLFVTEITSNPAGRPCKRHFDIWYKIPIDVEPAFDAEKLATEFYETRWMSIAEAEKLVTDPSTLEALTVFNSA